MEHSELARRLVAAAHLRGSFVLRSGARTTEYFDKYRFESDPVVLAEVVRQLAPLVPPGTDALAGLELGGIPVVTALSAATGLPAVFVRKEAKAYGTRQLAEGLDVAGRRLTVVEDVITTGGQVVASVTDLRRLGARVDRALCVIDRSGGDHRILHQAGIDVAALFSSDQLPLPTGAHNGAGR